MGRNVRANLARLMDATIADEQKHGNWRYTMARPNTPETEYVEAREEESDCSKGVQKLARWAGAPDPMGEGYGGFGNSTTIALHLRHVSSLAEMAVGDPVTFGWDGSEHAAMTRRLVLADGRLVETVPKGAKVVDLELWSDGHQGAPNYYRLSQDGREHQLLKLPVPAYKPDPDDALRARTGWFAWAAWWLGEGDWRSKGKRNPSVRPNVPKRVPLKWWARLAKFLKNRKRGNKPTTPRGAA